MLFDFYMVLWCQNISIFSFDNYDLALVLYYLAKWSPQLGKKELVALLVVPLCVHS